MNIAYDKKTGTVVEAGHTSFEHRKKAGYAVAAVDRLPREFNHEVNTITDLVFIDGVLRMKTAGEYSAEEIATKELPARKIAARQALKDRGHAHNEKTVKDLKDRLALIEEILGV